MIAVVGILAGVILAAVMNVRAAGAQLECQNHMRQIGVGLHQYHDVNHVLPPGVTHPIDRSHAHLPQVAPYALMHWHQRILPYIGQTALWQQIVQAYDKDPVSFRVPPHTAFFVQIPLFLCPTDGPRKATLWPQPPGTTSYVGVEGLNHRLQDGTLFLDSRVRLLDIQDGTSYTLLVGERPASQNWQLGNWHGNWGLWSHANATLGVRYYEVPPVLIGCKPGPYHFERGSLSDPCSALHFWSFHAGGGNFLFADGSVRFLPYAADAILPDLATRAGKEPVAGMDY